MSASKRISDAIVAVDPSTANVLREQTLATLEANHYFFEDLREFGPEAQFALSVRFRDAFAVLDAIGWARPADPPASVDVPISLGLVEQLFQRRYDLRYANLDRAAIFDTEPDEAGRAQLRAAIAADNAAGRLLDDLIAQATKQF